MACSDCGCNCCIVDETGAPYGLGEDANGNECIVIPRVDKVGCAPHEFFFEGASCVGNHRVYPFVSPSPVVVDGAAIVLSHADNDTITIEARKNGALVGVANVPAGSVSGSFAGGTFPLQILPGDQLTMHLIAAGTLDPVVSVSTIVCLGHLSPATVNLGTCLAMPSNGVLSPGQSPANIGFAALIADVGNVCRFDGTGGESSSLWTVAMDTDGVTPRWGRVNVTLF